MTLCYRTVSNYVIALVLNFILILQFIEIENMHSSLKSFNIETAKSSSNYVTVGNSSQHTGVHKSTNRGNIEEPHSFKSNFISRYPSQKELQSYQINKGMKDNNINSPKSEKDYVLKKPYFF